MSSRTFCKCQQLINARSTELNSITKQACKSFGDSQNVKPIQEFRATLLALLGVSLKGKLDVESFIQYMEAAKALFPAQPEHDEFAVSLIESIWIKHSEIPKTDVQSKDAFNSIVKPILSQLIEKQIVSAVDCHIHLEAETLIACKITRLDSDGFTRMASQANTQKHFSQHKFNLMREENEGFAKLLIEVN